MTFYIWRDACMHTECMLCMFNVYPCIDYDVAIMEVALLLPPWIGQRYSIAEETASGSQIVKNERRTLVHSVKSNVIIN